MRSSELAKRGHIVSSRCFLEGLAFLLLFKSQDLQQMPFFYLTHRASKRKEHLINHTMLISKTVRIHSFPTKMKKRIPVILAVPASHFHDFVN